LVFLGEVLFLGWLNFLCWVCPTITILSLVLSVYPLLGLVNDIDIHFEFGSTNLFLKSHFGFALIEQLVGLKTTHTWYNLRTILGNIINFNNSLDRTIFLECLGVEHFYFQLKWSIELRAFGSFIAQLDKYGFLAVVFNLGAGFYFNWSNYKQVFKGQLLVLFWRTHLINILLSNL